MSTGLLTLAAAGRNARSAPVVADVKRRHVEAIRLAGVGRENPGPAGVGDDRDAASAAAPAGSPAARATSNSSSSVSVRMTPGLPKQRIDQRIARRPRAGVRRRRARAGRRSSGLDRDDRLACGRRGARSRRTCAGCRSSRGRAG